jgi:tRNA modification GTPase
MNGKIDLAQAEAVQSLIGAKSELAMKASKHQLEGALSKKIASFQKEIIDVAAILEAWVDFPEEGLEFSSLEEIQKTLSSILQKMEQFRETFKEGKILHEGLTLALCGAPNVGKSSLMNALLGKNRAIVTDIAGTTRDILEEDLRLGGIHFKLVDTAGIRESNEIVEKEGIRRSRQMLEEADLVLIVLDSTRALAHEEKEILNQTQCLKRVLIWNKADLPSDLAPPPEAVVISAKKGEGLDLLKKTIIHSIFSGKPLSKEEVVITNARHHQALGEAISYLTKVNQGLFSGVSPEFLSADIRASLQELGSIIGQDISEEILTAIFSKFCVGK